MSEKETLSSALGKKRRNNLLEEGLHLIDGEVAAARHASRCLEQMFDYSPVVPDSVYEEAGKDCAVLDEALDNFTEALRLYRRRVDEIRARLVELARKSR